MQNRLYCGDCKEVLQKLISENVKVDLIYLDPPFNSNAVYNLTYKSKHSKTTAQQKAFSDMWTPTAQTQLMFEEFKLNLKTQTLIDESVKTFLEVWLESLSKSNYNNQKLLNYLLYMTERLILMKGVLKETGSIYLHCDPTASHYLKVIMDGIFGYENFRNEVVWCYRGGGVPKKDFAKRHDILLRYSKTKDYIFNVDSIRIPYSQDTLDRLKYKAKAFRGDKQYDNYQKNELGKHPEDWFSDIQPIMPSAKERLGYPTQKPRALLERIIKASCPEDGVVLDTFCGCGTTIDAAIQLKRNWIGIDISSFAVDIIDQRIKDAGLKESYHKEYIKPRTWDEYQKLNPYEKQDFLVKELGGIPNKRKSGDKGVDGELTIHLGLDKDKKDIWGKVIFSVKTGMQCNPTMIRELKGTMQDFKADIGILILDKDPSFYMMEEVVKSTKLKYQLDVNFPAQEYNTIQIYTAEQILNGIELLAPPSLIKIKRYRETLQGNLFNH